jgi:hypothetical protein
LRQSRWKRQYPNGSSITSSLKFRPHPTGRNSDLTSKTSNKKRKRTIVVPENSTVKRRRRKRITQPGET